MTLDEKIFKTIFSLSGLHWISDFFLIFIAQYLPYFLIVAFLAIWYFKRHSHKDRLYYLLLSAFALLLSRGLIVEGIRFFYYRLRPFRALNLEPLISPLTSPSMPSGHATVFFALATLVYFVNRKYFWWFLVGAIFIGFGRIAVGVHWPSDILAGAFLGVLAVILSHKILPKI